MIEQAKLQKQAADEELRKAQLLYEEKAISKNSYEEAKGLQKLQIISYFSKSRP